MPADRQTTKKKKQKLNSIQSTEGVQIQIFNFQGAECGRGKRETKHIKEETEEGTSSNRELGK